MAAEKAAQPTQLKITQVRGTIGARWKQRESLRTWGSGGFAIRSYAKTTRRPAG